MIIMSTTTITVIIAIVMIITIIITRVKDQPPQLTLNEGLVERVTITFKLLGVHVSCNLNWAQRVDATSSTVLSRLYFLKQLKRCGVSVVDLLCFYTPQWCVQCSSKLRPMLVRSGTRV